MIVFDGWRATRDLIPPSLVIRRYFPQEQATIERLEAEKEAVTREREESEEEHGGEDGLFANARNENDKLNKASVMQRIKELERERNLSGEDEESCAELSALEQYLALVEREAKASKKVREAVAALERKVAEKYGALSEEEVKRLVIGDKWMETLDAGVRAELERLAQNLTGRIRTLAERYETPLPQLAAAAEELAAKVETHLDRMGFAFELQSIAAKVE